MKRFLLGLFLLPSHLWAQSFYSHAQKIGQQISQNEIDKYVASPSSEGVSGEFIANMLPATDPDADIECAEPVEPKETRYEVILIANGNGAQGKEELLPRQLAVYSDDVYKERSPMFLTRDPSEISSESVTNMAQSYWTLINGGSFDPKSSDGQEFFIESLVQKAAASSLSEKELAPLMASIISATYTTEDEKFNALSALSSRFYRNYNDARNPGSNNSKYNPDGVALPEGAIAFKDMLKAASEFNEFGGGVCNDVTETIAKVGEHLFPDKDVLAVNAGSHFGLAVVDGKSTRIIDGSNNIRYENELKLNTSMSPSNLRISKVKDGVLREIAVTDTKMGQLTEAAFDTGKNLLKTDLDISSLVAHLKKNNFGVSVASSQFDNSNVLVVVAKYQKSSDKWSKYLGVGVSGQDYKDDDLKTKYQVHFRAGVERKMFQYVNEKTRIDFSTGLRMQGMYTLNTEKPEDGGINAVDLSLGLDMTNRIRMQNISSDKSLRVNSYVEVENTVGGKNWGELTGIMSRKEGSKFMPLLKNMNLHLNQINADVNVEKDLNKKMSLMGNAHYQGSNIGQKVSVLAGVNIKAPEGAEILVFTGYTNADIKGFQTKHSLLASPTGIDLGVKYKNKKNMEFSGGVRGLAGETPSINGTIKIPLNKKRR